MTNKELVKELHSGFFKSHDDLNSALEYVQKVAKGTNSPSSVLVAVQVVMNTIAKIISDNEKELAQ
jgi:hypothetical protein